MSWRQGAGQWGARARDWAYLRASDQVRRAWAARTPLGRNASPPDIAAAGLTAGRFPHRRVPAGQRRGDHAVTGRAPRITE